MVDIAAISYYVVVEACLVAWWPLSFVGQLRCNATVLPSPVMGTKEIARLQDCKMLARPRAGGARGGRGAVGPAVPMS